MMEYERFVKITVVRDTNKATDRSEYDNALDACRALLELLTDEERSELAIVLLTRPARTLA